MRPFLEAMHADNLTLRRMQSSLDGDMHQYIAWITQLRGHATVGDCARTSAQILGDFLQSVSRDSDVYRRVFACFYASRHSNRSEQAIAAFVSEVEWHLQARCETPRPGHASTVAVTRWQG